MANLDDLYDAVTQRGFHGRKRPSTPPLADRMREAADTIEQWNAMCGMNINHFVTPAYLRSEADKL